MKIWAYVTIWNEEKMLDFYLKHYSKFCDKIIFFDNESTDRSHEIINSYPNTEIRVHSTGGTFNDYTHLELKHSAIKEARGNCDYVIISDCDEFIYHTNIREFLKEHLNKTAIFYPAGYQMASNYFPNNGGQIYESIKTGEPSPWYSKPIMLNPNMVKNFTWVEGCHELNHDFLEYSGEIYHVVPESVRPNGEYKEHQWGNWKIMFDLLHIFKKEPLKLLHYKFIGSDFVTERYNQYIDRVSEANKKAGLAVQYERSIGDGSIQTEIDEILDKSDILNFL